MRRAPQRKTHNMKKSAYTLAFALGGALLLLLCVLILVNNSRNDRNALSNFEVFTPTGGDLPGLATDAPQQAWDDWVGGQTAVPIDYATAPPAQPPAPTPAPATPEPTRSSALRNGDQGTDVAYVQQRLRELGYLSGNADGVFGNATERAVKDFQAANGLTADGVVGNRTLAMLDSPSAKSKSAASASASTATDTSRATAVPAPRSYTASTPNATYGYLAPGNTGSKVRSLQNRLIELGYLSGSASGTYDDATEEAVRAFQARNGQWVDGKAGPDTQTALFSNRALAAPRD